jgi:hypothetical protein
MAYASQSGRARTSAKKPQAFAVCFRCGMWYNRVALQFQYEWRGPTLVNTFILVCNKCLDVPTEQNRAITLPADPEPVFYPSVQDFESASIDLRAISQLPRIDPKTGIPIPSTTLRATPDGQNRSVNPFGAPDGLSQDAVMPYNGAVQKAYGVPLQVLSVTADGTATVQVTCSAPHALQTDSQMSVEGLANTAACGFYSVTVLSATAFTYMTYGSIAAGALLTPTTRIITALVGLPRGYARIPKIDGPALKGGIESPTNAIEFEPSTGAFLLEDGITFFELEEGP